MTSFSFISPVRGLIGLSIYLTPETGTPGNQIERHKRYARLEQLFLKLLDRKVEFLTRKGRIDESTSNELSVIINYLRKSQP